MACEALESSSSFREQLVSSTCSASSGCSHDTQKHLRATILIMYEPTLRDSSLNSSIVRLSWSTPASSLSLPALPMPWQAQVTHLQYNQKSAQSAPYESARRDPAKRVELKRRRQDEEAEKEERSSSLSALISLVLLHGAPCDAVLQASLVLLEVFLRYSFRTARPEDFTADRVLDRRSRARFPHLATPSRTSTFRTQTVICCLLLL
jgi:hypothetical protein